MRSSLHEIASVQYGTHHTMSDHERSRRSSLLGERQELVRYLAHSVAIERNEARCPETEQYREQKQWILRRLSEGFSLFDQQTCSLCSGLSFRSTISFDVHNQSDRSDAVPRSGFRPCSPAAPPRRAPAQRHP